MRPRIAVADQFLSLGVKILLTVADTLAEGRGHGVFNGEAKCFRSGQAVGVVTDVGLFLDLLARILVEA